MAEPQPPQDLRRSDRGPQARGKPLPTTASRPPARSRRLQAGLAALPAIAAVPAVRALTALAAAACLAAPAALRAQPVADAAPCAGCSVFAVAATAQRASLLGGGLSLPWSRRYRLGGSVIEARTEFSIGRIAIHQGDANGRDTFAQVGVTPVFRAWLGDGRAWFVDAGIGANVIAPRLHTRRKEFGTTFNFGDRIGIGWRDSSASAFEVGLYALHYSNAGIREPNPGENFVLLSIGRPF